MLQSIRRVVTGTDHHGKSTVIFDGISRNQAEIPGWPGMGVTLLWRESGFPTSNTGNADSVGDTFSLTLSGAEFMIFHCPPLSDLEKMTPEQQRMAWQPKALLPASAREDKSLHPGMHAHHTTDCIAVLQGQITLILEAGEVTLEAGDTLINRGSPHAWENRGSIRAIVASVSLGANPPG